MTLHDWLTRLSVVLLEPIVLLLSLLLAVDGCVPRAPSDTEKMERNMGQSGVNDVQIPLIERQEWAEKYGLKKPVK